MASGAESIDELCEFANSQLEEWHVWLEKHPEVKKRVEYKLARRQTRSPGKPRYLAKLVTFTGPDHETLTLLEWELQEWTKWKLSEHSLDSFPSKLFESSAPWQAKNTGYPPVVHVAHQCFLLEKGDAKAVILRRIYCVVLSRLQQKYDLPGERLLAYLQNLLPWAYPGDILSAKVKRWLEAGSRLDCWINDVCTGAILYMGRELGNDIWEQDISKHGEGYKLARQHLQKVGFEANADRYTPIGDEYLRRATQDAEGAFQGPPLPNAGASFWRWPPGVDMQIMPAPNNGFSLVPYDPFLVNTFSTNLYTRQ